MLKASMHTLVMEHLMEEEDTSLQSPDAGSGCGLFMSAQDLRKMETGDELNGFSCLKRLPWAGSSWRTLFGILQTWSVRDCSRLAPQSPWRLQTCNTCNLSPQAYCGLRAGTRPLA